MIISAKLRMSWVVLFQFQCLDFYMYDVWSNSRIVGSINYFINTVYNNYKFKIHILHTCFVTLLRQSTRIRTIDR
jgi:hypothetical protein